MGNPLGCIMSIGRNSVRYDTVTIVIIWKHSVISCNTKAIHRNRFTGTIQGYHLLQFSHQPYAKRHVPALIPLTPERADGNVH